jgi:NAD(P)-dependent dehydrogenase (short-subunit alcohol dehydrogenase family)
VTGASRGIGLAVARRLAGRRAALAICARDDEMLQQVAAELRAAYGAEVLAVAADMAQADDVASFATTILDRFGPPEGVVCNAALLGPVGPLAGTDMGRWDHTVRVNVTGPAILLSIVAGPMAQARRGSIVTLSGGGLGGPSLAPNTSAYLASKAAVVVLTEALAKELAASGVRVNAVAPGRVNTGFNQEVLDVGPAVAGEQLFDDVHRALLDTMTTPERFLDLLDFLLSDESSWLTGRLLSARWDSPASLRERRAAIESSDLLRLRRIDDDLYAEVRGEM